MNECHQLTSDNKNLLLYKPHTNLHSCFLDTQGYVLFYMCLTKTTIYYLRMLNMFTVASCFKDTLHDYDD